MRAAGSTSHAAGLGFDVTYEEHAGEDHTWSYWDSAIQRAIRWLPRPHGP